MIAQRVNYRKLAFAHYDPLCAHRGFGVPAILEVAHLDGDRSNNELSNLVILCPNRHKMHDLDLISTATITEMRDRPKVVQWSKWMKDAGQKGGFKRLRRAAGRKSRRNSPPQARGDRDRTGGAMIANDQELQTTLDRIAWFQQQVPHLRRTETNPVNYRASVSGFLLEIDRMQLQA